MGADCAAPCGFNSTINTHLKVERTMSNFLGTEGAMLYSDVVSAPTSIMATFAKRGNLLITDKGVN
jgi:serine palmitoyltransferase